MQKGIHLVYPGLSSNGATSFSNAARMDTSLNSQSKEFAENRREDRFLRGHRDAGSGPVIGDGERPMQGCEDLTVA